MFPIDLENLCEDVRVIVHRSVDFIRKERLLFNREKIEQKGLNDLVSYVDKTSERILVEGLQGLIPGAGFITEEDTLNTEIRDWQWIIDPLDGTTNFIHGIPCFCVSVGLIFKQQVVLGVVHEVNLDECFYGWKNGGAYLNGVPIQVSAEKQLSQSLIATGFPYTDFRQKASYMQVLGRCMEKSRGIRRMGSAAVDLAYVACGRFECFFEYGLKPWDISAGTLLVSEAGGVVSDFCGGKDFLFGAEIIASCKFVHPYLLEIVKSEFKR